MVTRAFLVSLLALFLAVAARPAHAQDSAVKIDLNKLEPREGACRAYFVLENETASEFTGFTLDLYIFGADGVVTKRVAVDTAPLTPAKTRVRPVDFRDMDCAEISMVLVNDVIDCSDSSGERANCVGLITLSNRTNAQFFK